MTAPSEMKAAADDVHQGQARTTTPRTLISWFGAKRRGYWVVKGIRDALRELDLVTNPDFEHAWIDETLAFERAAPETSVAEAAASAMGTSHSSAVVQIAPLPSAAAPLPIPPVLPPSDPTYRIGKLEAANRAPISVTPDDPVSKAVTLMMMNDYSQLPIMQNERSLKGLISWESIAQTTHLGKPCGKVSDSATPAHETSSDTSLFEAIAGIIDHGYALIRARDNRISGIVTASDLGVQLGRLGEPFLLLGELENYLRRAIEGKFLVEQLRAVKDPNDPRQVNSVEDLTFGEYIRLLENPANWALLKLSLERSEFIKGLGEIRDIRNDVMHFDPDGPSEEDLVTLRRWVSFFQRLATLKAL